MEQPNFKNIDKIKDWITNIHEKYFVELKKAQELPAAFWDSYSAFCNTSGGWILLGVIKGNPTNTIQGVGNISKAQTNLWDMLSNPNKVNYRSVDNEDVHVVNIDGAEVMIVCVKEADYIENVDLLVMMFGIFLLKNKDSNSGLKNC